MLWIIPAFFAIFGLPATLFPRFLVERYSHKSAWLPEEVKKDHASSVRAMGVIFLLTAIVFAVLICTNVLR